MLGYHLREQNYKFSWQLIQFQFANMKPRMKMGVFMCIDKNEETVLYYSNNKPEKLAEGMNLLMEQLFSGKKLIKE